MNILALDPGIKTGWALLSNKTVKSGIQQFELKRGESPGMRHIRYENWLRQMFTEGKPDIVVFEMAHHRGGAATASLALARPSCAYLFVS